MCFLPAPRIRAHGVQISSCLPLQPASRERRVCVGLGDISGTALYDFIWDLFADCTACGLEDIKDGARLTSAEIVGDTPSGFRQGFQCRDMAQGNVHDVDIVACACSVTRTIVAAEYGHLLVLPDGGLHDQG